MIDKHRGSGTLGLVAMFEGLHLLCGISDLRSVVLWVILQGDVEAVMELLDQGADPNLKDNAGWTPLVRPKHHMMHVKA